MSEKYFDNWEIVENLGSGSFGAVYKIKKEEFGNTYYSAMKVIHIPQDQSEPNRLRNEGMTQKDLSTYYDQFVKDFSNEIMVMANLQGNTNIVAYNDHKIVQNEDGIGYTIYIRMEYLIPLESYLYNGGVVRSLDEQEVIKFGLDMCNALDVCDRNKIIHRDIKTDNCFISKTGDYKLGDFGIARQFEGTQCFLSKKGTFSYMAPEIYIGKTYNKTVDIYSLGMVLYKLLNHGRLPFFPPFPSAIKPSDSENALFLRMQGTPIPSIPGVNAKLNGIIQKCCAYRSEDRYQSVQALQYDLKEVYTQPYKGYITPAQRQKTAFIDEQVAKTAIVPSITDNLHAPVAIKNNTQKESKAGIYAPSSRTQTSKKQSREIVIVLGCIAAVIAVIATIIIVYFSTTESGEITTTTTTTTEVLTTTEPTTQKKTTTTTHKKNTTTAKKQTSSTKQNVKSSVFYRIDDDIRSIVSSNKLKDISVSLIDVKTGETVRYGSPDALDASALVIYPLLYAYEYEMDSGRITPNTAIPLNVKYQGRGVLNKSYAKKTLTVEDLFYYAMRFSDNSAMNSLLDYLGFDKVEAICKKRGFNSISLERYVGETNTKRNNVGTSVDLAKMIRNMLYRRSFGYDMMSKYSGLAPDDIGRIGIAYTLDQDYETINGYNSIVYDEAVHIKNAKQDWVIVFLSKSGSFKEGVDVAEQIGERLTDG